MSCVFCSIIEGKIPCAKMYEDEDILIFKDIEPKAEKHYLAILKKHFAYLSDMGKEDEAAVGMMLKKISSLQKELGLEDGYRIVINQGKNAGQTVFHLHIHIMGGQPLPFPDFKI